MDEHQKWDLAAGLGHPVTFESLMDNPDQARQLMSSLESDDGVVKDADGRDVTLNDLIFHPIDG